MALASKSMEKLKLTKIYSSCCCICFENPLNELIVTKCGHLFCKQCFEAWYFALALNCAGLEKCPLCQTSIRKPYERKFEMRLEIKRLETQNRITRTRYMRLRNLCRRLKNQNNSKCCWMPAKRAAIFGINLLYQKITTKRMNIFRYSFYFLKLYFCLYGLSVGERSFNSLSATYFPWAWICRRWSIFVDSPLLRLIFDIVLWRNRLHWWPSRSFGRIPVAAWRGSIAAPNVPWEKHFHLVERRWLLCDSQSALTPSGVGRPSK